MYKLKSSKPDTAFALTNKIAMGQSHNINPPTELHCKPLLTGKLHSSKSLDLLVSAEHIEGNTREITRSPYSTALHSVSL